MLAAPKIAIKGTDTPYCSPAQSQKKTTKHKVLKEKHILSILSKTEAGEL